jgi:hypothetical protein
MVPETEARLLCWSHVRLGRPEKHTTRTTIVSAFQQISENVILIVFGTSKDLLNCSILTSANSEYINSAPSLAALKQAQYLLCEAS